MTRTENEFAALLPKLSVEHFLGVAKMMNIDLVDGDSVKDAEKIIEEMFVKFSSYSKKQQKNLLKIMRAAAKK